MKTTATLLLLSSLLLACSSDSDEGSSAVPPPGSSSPTPEKPPIARTMGTARAMATHPDNLLWDPTFASLDSQFAFAVSRDSAKLRVDVPPTSPAGTASSVLVVEPAGPGGSAFLIGTGGTGPFDVRVFLSLAEGAAPPSVSLVSATGEASFDIPAVTDADQKHGDRTYRLYRARIPDPILGMIVLAITSADAKPIVVSAPELISSAAPATMSFVPPALRGKSNAALRAAISEIATRPAIPIRPDALERQKDAAFAKQVGGNRLVLDLVGNAGVSRSPSSRSRERQGSR